jgi:hypothetical protein
MDNSLATTEAQDARGITARDERLSGIYKLNLHDLAKVCERSAPLARFLWWIWAEAGSAASEFAWAASNADRGPLGDKAGVYVSQSARGSHAPSCNAHPAAPVSRRRGSARRARDGVLGKCV